jgi:putative ABC transport system substrate-binding protein
MNIQSKIIQIGAISILVGAFVALAAKKLLIKPQSGPVVGIIQTASHPALDAVARGFQEELARLYEGAVSCRVQNGEGNVQQLSAIASQFSYDSSVSLLFCIATRAAQAALSVGAGQPIVFSAVTDASVLPLTTARAGITGHCDMIDIERYVRCICTNIPLKTVTILYNPADMSSVAMVNTSKSLFEKQGKKVLLSAVVTESEMPLVAATACQKADAIFCPLDGTVAVTIDVLAHHAAQNNKPVFVCDGMLLRDGILCAGGVSYHALGVKSAQSAARILKGDCLASQIPIVDRVETDIVFHGPTARKLVIQVPEGCIIQEGV